MTHQSLFTSSFKEFCKKIFPKRIINLINKIKNNLARISRKIKILKIIKNRLIELSVKLKKETSSEKKYRIELLNSIKNIDNQTVECTSLWDKWRRRLRSYILRKDPRNFLRWDLITEITFGKAHKCEFDYLVNNNWNKWSSAIEETWVGNPSKYRYYQKSSGNLIHVAYSLAQFVDYYKIDIKQTGNIIEFGGGYGCLAKLINDLGFKGKYTLFDIPEFLALQKYYLQSSSAGENFYFISQVENLSDLNPDIFIANWSFSEVPIKLREEFFKKIGKPKYVSIGYEANFETIDNIKYFQEYMKNNQDYNWVNYEISHLPRNYYLTGKKN